MFGRKTQFDKVVRRLAAQPLRDSIGPISVALANVQLIVPVEGDVSTTVGSELKLLASTDREGNLWAHAHTSPALFAKALPQGCGAAAIEFAKFVAVVDELDGFAGIVINAGSPSNYPIFKSAFAFVREALFLPPAEADHDPLYEEAALRLSPTSSERDQRRGIELLLRVLTINPNNWPAMWMIGKAYQRLREFEQAFEWFKRADEAHPRQPDVNREAAISAMELGRPEQALLYCRQAIDVNADDPGLRANLALALLFSGSPLEAMDVARDALRRDPSDAITKQIVELCEEVVAGKRTCPRHQREI